MGINNAIANFGWQAGQNIQNTVGNALARREQRNIYAQQQQQAEQERQRKETAQLDAQETEFGANYAKAYWSAPEQERGRVLEAFKSDAAARGYITPNEAAVINDGYMYKLAGASGLDISGQDQARPDAPSNVREYEYFNSLTPDQQKTYLNVKRASQLLNLGDRVRVREPFGGTVDHRKGVPPQNTPQHNAAVTTATEQAKADVKDDRDTRNAEQRLSKAFSSYKALTASPEKLDLIYGRGESLLPSQLRSQEGQDLLAQRDQFVAILRLAEVGQLKGTGPITENEQQMLGQAATVLLIPDISPALAYQAAQQAWGVLQAAAGRAGSNNNQPQGTPGINPVAPDPRGADPLGLGL